MLLTKKSSMAPCQASALRIHPQHGPSKFFKCYGLLFLEHFPKAGLSPPFQINHSQCLCFYSFLYKSGFPKCFKCYLCFRAYIHFYFSTEDFFQINVLSSTSGLLPLQICCNFLVVCVSHFLIAEI